ncbi:hypothetical protein RclHR1_06380007 [Rhizophagus clarus]|uniref:Uncharacterized protein n=1 Tax=Rhizophagus clarus TaxID=94130 RepID=A0A2Z6RRX9_9GLOM|nr:hypothetical protein RclHR1_06380007 [Rhizophagus clarus]
MRFNSKIIRSSNVSLISILRLFSLVLKVVSRSLVKIINEISHCVSPLWSIFYVRSIKGRTQNGLYNMLVTTYA